MLEHEKIKGEQINFGIDYFKRFESTPTLFVTLLTQTSSKYGALSGFRNFRNILRRKLYGRNGINNPKKKLVIYPVIERHYENDFYHFHLMVGFNDSNDYCRAKDVYGLIKMIKESWALIKIHHCSTFSSAESCQIFEDNCNDFKAITRYMLKAVRNDSDCEILYEFM